MGRAPCCDKANVKKGPWSPEEDAKLKSYIQQHGTGGNWIALPQKIGLKRCGKSCRLRWLNYLRPDIKRGGFSEDEDNIICSLYVSIGSRWSVIAAQLPGRTDNDVKNHWNTRLKNKLLGDRPRKERRWAARTPKQEAVDAGKGNSTAAAANGCQGSLLPQVPRCFSNQDPPAVAADHPSDGQFPIEVIGGRFSDHGTQDVRSPFHAPSSTPAPQYVCHYSPSSSDLIPPSTMPNHFNNRSPSPPGGHILRGAGGCLATELEELILCCNPVKMDGLDGFYGVDTKVISDNNATSSSESLGWEEISSLVTVCPPLISSLQSMYPPQQQPLQLEERYLHPGIP